MTTATKSPEATVVDLSDSVPEAPRRRGRPKGSKNKPRTGTTATRKRTTVKATAVPRTPRVTKEATIRACLIEKDGTDTKFTFFNEAGSETLVSIVPGEGWVLDRR